jgi:tRNA 2-selenouridine synthase SelU
MALLRVDVPLLRQLGLTCAVAGSMGCCLLRMPVLTRSGGRSVVLATDDGRRLPPPAPVVGSVHAMLQGSPLPADLHQELAALLAAEPEVLAALTSTQLASSSASCGDTPSPNLNAPVRKLPIESFLEAAYGSAKGAAADAALASAPADASELQHDGRSVGNVLRDGGVRLLDVRSPAEFSRGHLPGAINVPLFEDDERVEVGTLFAQRGKEEAIRHGLAIVGPKLRELVRGGGGEGAPCHLDGTLASGGQGKGGRVLVYCWRGGMRSQSVAWLLRRCGVARVNDGSDGEVQTLEGGYRSFRQWATRLVGQDSPAAKAAAGMRARVLLQPGDVVTTQLESNCDSANKMRTPTSPSTDEASSGERMPDIRAASTSLSAGTRCFKANEFESAIRHVSAAIAQGHPQRAACYNLRGQSRAQLDQLKAALEDFDRAVSSMPTRGKVGWKGSANLATLVNRAFVLQRMGQYKRASKDLKAALEIDPKHKRAKRALTLLQDVENSEPSTARQSTAAINGDNRTTSGPAPNGSGGGEQLLISVIGGRTGSGKTEILDCLRQCGESVIDLEALACHRGSAFGAIGQPEQPSNEQFENRCALAWRRCISSDHPAVDSQRRVWIEHEGPHIGKCKVPPGIVALINGARGGFVVLDMPRPLRVARLVQDYCALPSSSHCGSASELAVRDEQLGLCVSKLRKKLGEELFHQAAEALRRRAYDVVCDMMLDHYDALYDYHRETNTSCRRATLRCTSVDAMQNARFVLAAAAVVAPYSHVKNNSLPSQCAQQQNCREHESISPAREVEGLRLFVDVADAEWQARLVEFAGSELEAGRAGRLIGKTYSAPASKWAERKQSREMLQYGCYTNSNRVQPTVTVAPMPGILLEVIL